MAMTKEKALALANARLRLKQKQTQAPEESAGAEMSLADKAKALARGAVQGLTFGFGEELEAAGAGLGGGLAAAVSGKPVIDTAKSIARKQLESARSNIQKGREAMPIPMLGAELAGGLGSLGSKAAGKFISGAPNLAQAIGRGAAVGGLSGAAYGAGSGEGGVSGRGESAARGAAGGALLGGALPAVGAGARGAAKGVRNRFAPSLTREEKMLARNIPQEDTARVLSELERGQQQGRNVMLTDIGGGDVQAMARRIGRQHGGRRITEEALTGRQAAETKRIAKAASDEITSRSGGYIDNLDEINKAYRNAAEPLYDEAYKVTGLTSDAIDSLKKRPAFKTAMAKAKNLAENEGVDFDAVSDTHRFDYVKRSLDDAIDANTDSITKRLNQEGRAIQNIKKELVNEIDKLNPAYAEARKIAGGFMENRDAQRFGYELKGTMKPEQIRKEISKMSDAEKAAARLGVRERILVESKKAVDTGSGAKRVWGSELKREQLEPFFESKAAFDRFNQRLQDEITASKAANAILGGSQTDRNLQSGFISNLMGATSPRMMALSAADKLAGRIGQVDPAAMAAQLYQPGQQQNIQALRNILQSQQFKAQPLLERGVLVDALRRNVPRVAGQVMGRNQ